MKLRTEEQIFRLKLFQQPRGPEQAETQGGNKKQDSATGEYLAAQESCESHCFR